MRSSTRSWFVLAAGCNLVLAACGSDSVESQTSTAVSAAAPAIKAGAVAVGDVEIDGVVLDYVTSTPAGFEIGDEAPVLLAFPPGGQNVGLAESVMIGTYAPEATRLGWVVVSPAAPDGTLFFQGSESLVPGFLDWVESWVTVEGGVPHVAGISNGGISSFRYAGEHPERVRSLVTLPGFPRSDSDHEALANLADVPIRMYVGGTDTGWIEPAEQTVETVEALGGDIVLTIFPGEGHVMQSTADGVLIFEQLESFR